MIGSEATVLAHHVNFIAKRLIGSQDLCTEALELELQQNILWPPHLNASHATTRKATHAGETTLEPHHVPPLPTLPSAYPRDSCLLWAWMARRARNDTLRLAASWHASPGVNALQAQALLVVSGTVWSSVFNV
jgi:hypothetical protein